LSQHFDSDFSYSFYLKLLAAYSARYEMKPLRKFDPTALNHCYLRHDIDVCVDSALAMARIEAEAGYLSTYMFIPSSPLYRVESYRAELSQIRAMGHEVAIHFDVATSAVDPEDRVAVLRTIDEQCARLSDMTGEPINSVSFHRPLPIFLKGPDYLGGRVNAYSATLMSHYRSDSAGRWRNGNPIDELPNAPIAQLLTHPIWWGNKHEAPDLRLEHNYRRRTADLLEGERQEFSALLEETVPGVIRRHAPSKISA